MKTSSPHSYTMAANNRTNFAHRTATIAFACCSALLGISAALSLLATLYFDQANLFLADWKNASQQPEEKAIEVASLAIDRAISLHPFPPSSYHITRGRIQEWQHYTLPSNHVSATTSRAMALAAYQTAAELNPRWAMHRLDIAGVMIRQGKFNNRLAESLDSALLLAPYRPNVLIRLIELGLVQWGSLPHSAQEVVVAALLNASSTDERVVKRILNIAENLNQEAIVCQLLAENNIKPPEFFSKSCGNL